VVNREPFRLNSNLAGTAGVAENAYSVTIGISTRFFNSLQVLPGIMSFDVYQFALNSKLASVETALP